eukprot:c19983_g1_i1 orf=224-2056(+)
MSTEIKGRPVLRPAGNVALRQESKDNRGPNTRKPTKKPPPSPPLKPSLAPSLKISPPNSQPCTPRPSLTKSPVLKPTPSPKFPLRKPATPPPNIIPCLHTHNHASLEATSGLGNSATAYNHASLDAISYLDDAATADMGMPGNGAADMGASSLSSDAPVAHASPSSNHDSPEVAQTSSSLLSPNDLIYDLEFVDDELIPDSNTSTPAPRCVAPPFCKTESPHTSTGPSKKGASSKPTCVKSPASPGKPNPRITLSRSSSDNFHRRSAAGSVKACGSSKNPIRIGSQSLDDASLSFLVAAKKAAACELSAQRRLKVAEYGRKQGKASRVAPDVPSLVTVTAEPQRCKFITAQSDPLYVAYHDQEWGIPVHDDRTLFELLVLAGAQAELSWTTILHRRDAYRDAFCGYEAASVALFNEKHIQSLEADKALSLPGGKIRGVVENARRILEVVEEFGSLDCYLWSFLNNKPMINSYRYPKQVPAKTSKSEFISKDLVRRGFRFVGPTIIYSFMQASGMTNDHLVQCFRHHACMMQPTSFQDAYEEKLEHFVGVGHGVECDAAPVECDAAFANCNAALLHMDADQATHNQQHLCVHEKQTQHQGQQFNHTEIVHT